MTTLNGWQRVWLVASILWAVAIQAFAGRFVPDGTWSTQTALFAMRLWIVPVVAIYAFGFGVAWAMRGFHAEEPKLD